jgi:hypothetical protein
MLDKLALSCADSSPKLASNAARVVNNLASSSPQLVVHIVQNENVMDRLKKLAICKDAEARCRAVGAISCLVQRPEGIDALIKGRVVEEALVPSLSFKKSNWSILENSDRCNLTRIDALTAITILKGSQRKNVPIDLCKYMEQKDIKMFCSLLQSSLDGKPVAGVLFDPYNVRASLPCLTDFFRRDSSLILC